MGVTPKKVLWAYKTIIITKITYASVIWALGNRPDLNKNKTVNKNTKSSTQTSSKMSNTDEHDINSELETASHIICECPAFTKTRLEIFHQPFIKEEKLFQGNRLEATKRKILKFEEKTKFLKRTPKMRKQDLSPEKKNRKRKITIDKTNSKKTQNKIKKHREIWE